MLFTVVQSEEATDYSAQGGIILHHNNITNNCFHVHDGCVLCSHPYVCAG